MRPTVKIQEPLKLNRPKRIVIHLGPPKTGTTTVQAFLFRTSGVLAEIGVRYAEAGRLGRDQTFRVRRPSGVRKISGPASAHHLLPWTLLGEVEGLSSGSVWNQLLDEIAGCPEPTIVISSEAFSRLKKYHIEEIFELVKQHDVMPVAYLRRPMSRMISDYTQRVKSGLCHSTFAEFLRTERCLLEIYDGFIETWESVFGSGKLVLRNFDSAVAGPGLETDFASLITSCRDVLQNNAERSSRLNVSPGTQTIRTQLAINRLEKTLGRPVLLRRGFAAARKIAALRIPAALQRKFGSSKPLQSYDDATFVERLTSERYQYLLARCAEANARNCASVG